MTAVPQAQAAPKASFNRWWVLALICVPVFVGSLDLTVVSAFLPELIVELELPLQTGLDDVAWIVTAYLLAYTISLTFMGRVSDLVGRRVVYVVSLMIFLVGSVLVATAQEGPADLLYSIFRRMGERPDPAYMELYAIIFGRVIQALGAGALVPVSLALVADMFPPERRAQPLGIIGAIDTLGWVLGHLYGGLFVQVVHWHWLFWVNVPITLFALVFVLIGLRGVPQHKSKGRFDFIGMLLIIGALMALNFGLGGVGEVGASTSLETARGLPPNAVPLLLTSLVLFALFALVESRVKHPLINMRLFRSRPFSAGTLTNLFVGYALFVGLVIVPFLVNVRQEDASTLRRAALEVGILLSALTVPMAIVAIPGGWLANRIGFRATTIGGLLISIVGFVMIWQTWTLDTPNEIIALQMALVGVGLGLTFSPISTAVINSASEDERGIASALVLVVRLLGMTISISSLTTYALNRVNSIIEQQLGNVQTLDPVVYAQQAAGISVEVLAELALIGAIVTGAAVVAALFLPRTVQGETHLT